MKDYYKIMGIGRDASESDIKGAFRQLAVRYHPDKNAAHDAEDTFKEINEAYEVLSDPALRQEYDTRLTGPGFYSLKDVQPTQWTQRRSAAPSERTLFMLSMLKFTQVLFYFGCFWCFALLLDYIMPSQVAEEIVITDMKAGRKTLLKRNHSDLLVTDKGHHFPVMVDEMKYFPKDSPMKIYTSPLFVALIRVENHNGSFVLNNLATIYRNFCFAPILLLASCLTGLLVRKGLEFHVNLGIVVFLLMLLNIVFLFTSRL